MAKTEPETEETYPSSQSAGTRSKPDAHVVRFTAKENIRLHRVVRKTGRTIQTFLHENIMLAIEKIEKDHPEQTPTPRGYGLRRPTASLDGAAEQDPFAVSPFAPKKPAPLSEPTTPPQIVINTGAAPVAEIDRLALFVARGGPADKRDDRLKTAVEILKSSAKDETEKTQLAKDLDAKLVTLEGTKPPSSPFSFIESWLK